MATPKRRSLITLSTEHLPDGWLASTSALAGVPEKLDEILKSSRPLALRLNAPFSLRDAEIEQIKSVSSELRANSDTLIFVATGGTSLAARGLLETLRSPQDDGFEVLFAGDNLDPNALSDLIMMTGRRLSLVVAGQGPLSAETAVATALVRELVRQRHGPAEAQRRIVVAADGDCSDLIQLAGHEGYRLLPVSPGLSGRSAMYTAAGLMPLAACGFDVLQVAEGARSQIRGMESKSLEENPALAYATARLAAIEAGRTVELLWTEGPRWEHLADLWRYLLAGGSLLPTRAGLNSDRWMIEPWQGHNRDKTLNTLLTLEVIKSESTVPEVPGWPAVAALAGQRLAELFPRLRAQAITSQASEGFLTIGLPRLDAFHLGALCAFFQRSNALVELAREAIAFDEHPLRLGAAR